MKYNLKTARFLVDLLENKANLFGFRFGLDPIIGLIPVVGDVVTLAVSFYLVRVAVENRLPQHRIIQMVAYIILDFLLGIVPFLGNIFDFVYKANTLNLKILEQYLETKEEILEGEIIE